MPRPGGLRVGPLRAEAIRSHNNSRPLHRALGLGRLSTSAPPSLIRMRPCPPSGPSSFSRRRSSASPPWARFESWQRAEPREKTPRPSGRSRKRTLRPRPGAWRECPRPELLGPPRRALRAARILHPTVEARRRYPSVDFLAHRPWCAIPSPPSSAASAAGRLAA